MGFFIRDQQVVWGWLSPEFNYYAIKILLKHRDLSITATLRTVISSRH